MELTVTEVFLEKSYKVPGLCVRVWLPSPRLLSFFYSSLFFSALISSCLSFTLLRSSSLFSYLFYFFFFSFFSLLSLSLRLPVSLCLPLSPSVSLCLPLSLSLSFFLSSLSLLSFSPLFLSSLSLLSLSLSFSPLFLSLSFPFPVSLRAHSTQCPCDEVCFWAVNIGGRSGIASVLVRPLCMRRPAFHHAQANVKTQGQELKILDLQPLVAACKAETSAYVRQGDGVLAVALKSLCAPLQRRGNRGGSEWLLEEFARQVHVQQVTRNSYTAKYSIGDAWQCSLKVLPPSLNQVVQIVQGLSSTFPMQL